MKYIVGHENWCQAYTDDDNRDRIWIYLKTSDGNEIHLQEYDHWLTIQDYIDKADIKILQAGLRYRSHLVKQDVSNSEAVYIIRSVKGDMNGPSKECYTIGTLNDGMVNKTMWFTPALVEEMKTVAKIEDCFEAALVYNGKSETV